MPQSVLQALHDVRVHLVQVQECPGDQTAAKRADQQYINPLSTALRVSMPLLLASIVCVFTICNLKNVFLFCNINLSFQRICHGGAQKRAQEESSGQ